jgi:hypothetical protein
MVSETDVRGALSGRSGEYHGSSSQTFPVDLKRSHCPISTPLIGSAAAFELRERIVIKPVENAAHRAAMIAQTHTSIAAIASV